MARHGDARQRELRQVHASPLRVAQQAEGAQARGLGHRVVPAEHGSRQPAGRNQLADIERSGNLRFVLVGGVAVAKGQEYLVAGEQVGAAAIHQLQAIARRHEVNARKQQVPGLGRQGRREQCAGQGEVDAARRESAFGPLQPARVQRHERWRDCLGHSDDQAWGVAAPKNAPWFRCTIPAPEES